jgi:hypothetical protein
VRDAVFFFRINKRKIIENRTSAFLFFRQDVADVFMTTGIDDLHVLNPWMRENPDKERTFLVTAVSNALASRLLAEVENIKHNQVLSAGDMGYVLFQSEKIPDDFKWSFPVAKSNRGPRQHWELIEGIVKAPEFDTLAGNLAALVARAANPAFMAGAGVTKFGSGTISKILSAKGDEPVDICACHWIGRNSTCVTKAIRSA